MKYPKCFFIVVPIMLLHFSAMSQAQSPYGTVSMATGRAGVAANDLGEQVMMNPSAMAHAKNLGVGYFYRGGTTEIGERNQQLAITIMDNSQDIAFAGGFLYQQERQSYLNASDAEIRRIQLSAANFLIQQVSVGVSVFHYDVELEGGESYDKFDYNLGMLWNPNPVFAVGAYFENLGSRDTEFPDFYEPADRATVGVNYIFMPQFRMRTDVSQQLQDNPDDKKDYRVGIESLFDAYMVIRLGFESAQLEDREYFSAGLGFTGPRLQLDYSYRANVDYSGGALHSVDFRLPF